MRVWTKPELIVDTMELSQAYAAACGDISSIAFSCNSGHHKTTNWTDSVPIENLSDNQRALFSADNGYTISGSDALTLANSVANHIAASNGNPNKLDQHPYITALAVRTLQGS